MDLAAALCFLMAASVSAAGSPPEVSVIARGPGPGEMILVVVSGQVQGRIPKGTLAGQPLSFYKTRKGAYAALGAFDLEVATGPARLELELEGKGPPHFWSSAVMVEGKAFSTQQLKVAERFVSPPKVEEDRSEIEARQLKRLFAEQSPRALFSGSFKSPIPGATSSRFGERRVFNGVPKNPHTGADLRAKTGEPVRAPAAGKVVLTEDLFYSGKSVVLDHGLGLYTFYGHLSKIDVKHGQSVNQGERLGRVGATGRVTGPHLHWAAKLKGARVDPFSLIALPLARFRPAQ